MHDEHMYPEATLAIAEKRMSLSPDTAIAFREFGRVAFADGALSTTFKQLIAVAVAHVTQCPYCIRSHTRAALHHGASPAEIMEAVWVAAEMRAGAAYAHSAIALDVISKVESSSK
jgi:AhpD family alkylhydroperoxidase